MPVWNFIPRGGVPLQEEDPVEAEGQVAAESESREDVHDFEAVTGGAIDEDRARLADRP